MLTARDGVEALETMYSQAVDLVILDVMMPRKDGFEVLREIRRNPIYEAMPVILLTAKQQEKDIFDGYHHGADMILTKPFNPLEILNLIRL